MSGSTQIGGDIGSVDGNGSPNWQKAKLEGHLSFMVLRAMYGTVPDSTYARYTNECDHAGIPTSPYLFLRFGDGMAKPETQAESFLAMIGTPNKRRLPPAIDVEGKRGGLSSKDELDWVRRAYQTIRQAIGAPPMVYTSWMYWVDPDGLANQPAPDMVESVGWWKYWPFPTRSPAHYDPDQIANLGHPATPPPWGGQWIVQQYQGDALGYPGFISTIDLDRINVLREGATGDTVKWIQRRLGSVVVDGIWGPQTTTAVKVFQRAMLLVDDGICGYYTYACLAWHNV